MPRRFMWYLVGTVVAALGLWSLLLQADVGSTRLDHPSLAVLLLVLSVIAYQFPIQLHLDRKTHVASGPLLVAAILFPAASAMLLAFVAAFVGNALLRIPLPGRAGSRRPWCSLRCDAP